MIGMIQPERLFLYLAISSFLLLTTLSVTGAFTTSGIVTPISNVVFRPTRFLKNGSSSLPLCCRKRGKYTFVRIQEWEYDSDDIRWTTRIRRRMLRSRSDGLSGNWIKPFFISVQILMYICQIITTVISIRRKFPSYWPNHFAEMIIDSIWGSAVSMGPFTSAFGFSGAFSKSQHFYRYATSGLFHSSLLHLLIDIDAIRRLPRWLSTDLGTPLYFTTLILATISGNLAHVMSLSDPWDCNIILGSSVGICGLFGLMFVCLARISNINNSSGKNSGGQIILGMAIMLVSGLFLESVSTAANLGGFAGGAIIGFLCGPKYIKKYTMRRKNSAEFDPVSRDYRRVMGFGITTKNGLIPLKVIWGVLLTIVLSMQYIII